MTASNSNRRRPGTTTSTTASGSSSNLGQSGVQVGSDGAEPATGLGNGLTIDTSGDLGMRLAPGVSVDLTPGC